MIGNASEGGARVDAWRASDEPHDAVLGCRHRSHRANKPSRHQPDSAAGRRAANLHNAGPTAAVIRFRRGAVPIRCRRRLLDRLPLQRSMRQLARLPSAAGRRRHQAVRRLRGGRHGRPPGIHHGAERQQDGAVAHWRGRCLLLHDPPVRTDRRRFQRQGGHGAVGMGLRRLGLVHAHIGARNSRAERDAKDCQRHRLGTRELGRRWGVRHGGVQHGLPGDPRRGVLPRR